MARIRIATRLFVDEPLEAARTLGLDHGRAHFLRSVLRLSRGQHLVLFNGRDGEWLARIDGLGKGWASLVVESQRRPQIETPDLWLLFAPIKRARIDFLVEKATELGVSVLQPVMTAHSDVARVNTGRLAANAREAAEQCERLSVPEVREPIELFAGLATWPPGRRLLVCAESGTARPLDQVLRQAESHRESRARTTWAVLTGPEGGFARSELDALRKLDFVTTVGLGPRVLRADTAALAALACWQAVLGDGVERPPFRDDGTEMID